MSPNPFEPGKIRHLTLRNRILFAPLATQFADKNGRITPVMLSYYKHMALTGVGMVIVEGSLVSQEGRGWSRELDATGPEARDGLSQIAETIRELGVVPFLQLHHAGRQGLPSRDNLEVVAPSAIPCPVLDRPVRPLSILDIRDLVGKFRDAAGIAWEAGFAGIELHGAHGYLLHEFLSPLTNHRDDEYRLEPDGTNRFPLEVVSAIRSSFPDLAISYRMSVRDYLPRGLTLAKSVTMAKALEGAGVDLIHVSGGMYASLHGPESIVGPTTPPGVFRDDARDIKEAVSIPVAVVGKIQYPQMAFDILQNRDADFIALGRVLIRDRQWVRKARGLDSTPVNPCLLCNRCRFHSRGCPDRDETPEWNR